MQQKRSDEAALDVTRRAISQNLGVLRHDLGLTPAEAASATALGNHWGPRIVAQLEAGDLWNERVARALHDFYIFALAERERAEAA